MTARPALRQCALALGLALAGCGGGKGARDQKPLPPQVSLFGVRMQSWEGSTRVATGRAVRLTYDRSSGTFGGYEVLLRFLDTPNGVTDVRAPVATGNLTTRRVEGSGGVTLRSSRGLEADTGSVRYDGVSQVARGDERVRIRGPGYALDADRFAFYLLTEDLLFEGDIVSRLGEDGATP